MLFCAAVLMLVGSITAFAGSVNEDTLGDQTVVVLGDANCDGAVTIGDVTYIQMVIADMPVNGKFSAAAADVDCSEEVDIADAHNIQLWLAFYRTPFPIGEYYEVWIEPTTEAPTQFATDEEGWGHNIFRP